MTQEILDCLLIKSKFIVMTKEEIVAQACNKNLSSEIFKTIQNIMTIDHFFFSSNEILEKLDYFILKRRFSEDHDKDTLMTINDIIHNINIFNGMSKHDQQTIRRDWLCDEVVLRELPITKYRNYDVSYIYELIANDYFYINSFINETNKIELYNPVCCLSSINLVCNKYSQLYQENPYLISICQYVTDIFKKPGFKGYLTYSKIARRAEYNLNTLKHEIEIPEEVKNKKLELKLKKDKK